jgi:hypothetical protein
MEVGPMMGIGVVDGGMDVELPIFKMEIYIAEHIDLMNDMDMERRMIGCMMEKVWTRSDMEKGLFSFQMVHVMKVNSTRGNVPEEFGTNTFGWRILHWNLGLVGAL